MRNDQDDKLPLHARVSEVPIRTPVDVRLGLAVIPARYIFRGLLKGVVDTPVLKNVRHYSLDLLTRPFRDSYFAKLNHTLSQVSPEDIRQFITKDGKLLEEDSAIMRQVQRSGEAGKALIAKVRDIQHPWGASDLASNTIGHSLREFADALSKGKTPTLTLTEYSTEEKLRKAMGVMNFDLSYAASIGVGSLAMTAAIRSRVLNDIHSLFTETVGYELGKDPASVTMSDIFASKNQIIESTSSNYQNKMLQRLGISLMPFLQLHPMLRSFPFGDLAVGAWGAFWVHEVWGRQPTMLELLSDFANDKLNPKFGIGDKVRSSDIINLYQQYAIKFHPDWAFKSVLTNDPAENRIWAHSEPIFTRVADLMNETYNYKHPAHIDPETGLPETTASFTLPKFIYLLGNGLINAHQPEWSMAYIEIANTYGMKAVKEVQQAQNDGASLKDVVKKYPVERIVHAQVNAPLPQVQAQAAQLSKMQPQMMGPQLPA